jgi:hypothetical protein
MRHVLKVLCAALISIGLIGIGSPAQASTYTIYFYDGFNESGLLLQRSSLSSPLHQCYTMSSTVTNRTSSIKNDSNSWWYVFDGTTCSGTIFGTIYPNSIGNMNSQWNNDISSYYRSQ